MTPEAPGICVIGMHRSGTSLVAELIAALGVAMGPREEMLGPAPGGENPRGYWEQNEIRDLNDAVLSRQGGGLYDVVDLAPGWEQDPELDELLSEARDLKRRLFGDQKRWAFKDPRASLTFPFWLRALGPMHAVICLRDPGDVASSLETRDALAHPRWRTYVAWLAYTSWALEHTNEHPRLIVSYNDLIADPATQLGRLAEFLGKAADRKALNRASRAVDSTLRHHQSGKADADPLALPEAVELYEMVKAGGDQPGLSTRAAELRRSGLARVGPVEAGRLPDLRDSGDGDPRASERFDPDSASGVVAAEHMLRYRVAARFAHGRQVLDAGCGHGYGAAILADAGAARVVGIDISADAIQAAGDAHGNAEFQVGDLASLSFEDNSFDLVVCFETIQQLLRRGEALNELARVLRPGGLLLISAPNRLQYRGANTHHVFEYEPEELRASLAGHFSNVRLLRQHTFTVTVVLADGETAETADVLGGLPSKMSPSQELHTLAAASDAPLGTFETFADVLTPDQPPSPQEAATEAQHKAAALEEANAALAQRNRTLHETNSTLNAKVRDLQGKLKQRREIIENLQKKLVETQDEPD